ncbi:hypothetical protein L7F22_024376 [Adiantum nelumboides]|nr:hypothetical protein [Adiantum nelumboides]
MAFPNFHGRRGENAGNFLDDLEMAFLVSGREDEEIKLRAFPLVLREEAKVWFQDLDMGKQGNWEALKRAFLLSLPEGERVPNFLQKERFLAELTPILREKVKCKFPESFKEALTWAKLKDRKLQFQKSWRDHSQAASRLTTQEQAHPSSPNGSGDPHLDRLRRVTKQLDSLSINFIHGLQSKQPVQQQVGGQGTNDEVPRRPPRREYQCHNYGEYEPGMYFCPYPRGYGNAPPRGPQQQVSPPGMRPPPMPMCEQQQQPQQHQPIQILRQSTYALVPQPTTEVPPLPHDGVERAMNVISCEDKGEEKIMEAEAMPGKQATVAKEPRKMTTNDGANKKEKKRKKKASMTKRKIRIISFPVKSKPHNLIEEVQRQEPKLTWPQLLHLSPRMQQQWSKMEGRKESSELETSEDEWSTEDSSSTAEVTSSVSDSDSEKSSLLEAMVVVLTRPTTQDGGSIKETLSDEKIEDMLSTDLSKEERKEFEVMLQKHSPLFILDYKQIKGVTVVEHQINLKPESQPIAHRLCRIQSSYVMMISQMRSGLGYGFTSATQKKKMHLKGLSPEMYEECLLLYHNVYQGAPPNNKVGVHFAHGFTWQKCKGVEYFEGLVAWAVYAEGAIKMLRQQKTLNRKLEKWRSTNGPCLGSKWKFNAKNMLNYTDSTGSGFDWQMYSGGHQFSGQAKEEFLKKRAFGSMGTFGMSNVSSTTFSASTADVAVISNMKANAVEKLKEKLQCLKAIKISLDQSKTKRDE